MASRKGIWLQLFDKFSVIWNFQQVKNSNHECYRNQEGLKICYHECYRSQEGLKSCYCYKIVPKDESIVDSRFMHEKFALSGSPEAPLVVATTMKVSCFSISGGLGDPVDAIPDERDKLLSYRSR